MFKQGAEESFCKSWEISKIILRKCPNHGFEDIAQLSIFLNGLRSDTKMFLDDVDGGTMMAIDVEQVTRIIDAITSIIYQAPHDRQGIQKLLAQNKILIQQIEQLTAQMAKLPPTITCCSFISKSESTNQL